MPFYSDNNILFLAGKGDGNIRYYEYESDSLHPLAEYQSSTPQRGMCFLPRRALNVSECEIARAYKVAGTSIEPIAFVVPRKSDSFQSDIFPPAVSSEPALTAGEFFQGKTAPLKLISLENGAPAAATSAYTSPTPAPTKTASAPAPEPVRVQTEPTPAPSKKQSEPLPVPAHESRLASPITPAAVTTSPVETRAPMSISRSQSNGPETGTSAVHEENAKLTAELREARALIRNLELQVESLKANAQRAAKALMDG